jgi:hypothetical protein
MDITEDHGGIPIAVTVEMLRKRAQRGTIPACKQDGKWFVVLDATEAGSVLDGQDRTSRPGQDTPPTPPSTAISPAARSQLEAIRDEWLQPLVEQLKDQAEQIGRLRERAEIAEGERQAAEEERRVGDRKRDTLRWERDRLAEQVPAERAAWDELTRTTAERGILLREIARLRAGQVAPKKSPENRARRSPRRRGDGDLAGERLATTIW